MRNFFRLLSVSIVLLLAACSPQPQEQPTASGKDLMAVLREKNDIRSLNTTFSILLEKPDAQIPGEGILEISSGGDLDLSVYSLGFLAMKMTSKDGAVTTKPRIDSGRKRILSEGLRYCLFWWNMGDFAVTEDGSAYLLRNADRELWIDKKTLLPTQQKVYFSDGRILDVYYESPAKKDEIWYQKKIRIELSRYAVTLTIKDILFRS